MSSAGYGQRGGGGGGSGGYEAPACVQNAMMTKDKKPFTYTPGGIDLSQIKSERMAKRLARNAQAEGATGASQHNRPGNPSSPGGTMPTAAQSMGAAAMGMPFQVLPPPPPPPQSGPGMAMKPTNGVAPPPPPPPTSTTLAPPSNSGGLGSAPGSPNAARKSPTPTQRFEPPPMGFRPEIKIPPNPMANLRKVPPPVEKNTFWKEEYAKDRSKSPLPAENGRSSSPPSNAVSSADNNGHYEPTSHNNNNNNNDCVDAGFNKPMTMSPQQSTSPYQNETNNFYNNQYTPSPLQQQFTAPPAAPTTPPQQQQQQQQSPRPEFRSVPVPQSPAVNVYTRQTDSPQEQQQRGTESPFRFAQQQQQQQQQQQRTPTTISPLAQQQPTFSAATTPASVSPTQQPQAQATVPWRTQRTQQSQPIYNNVQQQQQQQQQQQRARDVLSPGPDAFGTQQPQQQYQGPKPTNVGSLYIAPLAAPTEPQAQNIVRQQLQQQQQQQRDSPMRQLPAQQPQQQMRWMSTKPAEKEQPAWARPEENGNVVPSSLHRMKSPPPPSLMAQQQQQQQQSQQQHYQAPQYQAPQGNGFANNTPMNFGANGPSGTTGLRLQINTNSNTNTSTTGQSGPKERIIPIQLEQTPTYPAAQPTFGAPAGHIIRSANQFVDQGYNNYPATQQQQQQQQQYQPQQQQQTREPSLQRVTSPRIMTQPQNIGGGGPTTRIIPISLETNNGLGRGGPISQSPVVLQNDPRSPPIQSKSFRILQKITDTVDDDNSMNSSTTKNNSLPIDAEPQLQRPQFARQMSAQQARNSPTIEQMRRMQIGPDQQQLLTPQPQQQQAWQQGNTTAQSNRFSQQRSMYDMPQQQYVPPSEQQVPEPKKYTGSAIPSRSFKILQAMTTPENAGPGQSDL